MKQRNNYEPAKHWINLGEKSEDPVRSLAIFNF